MTDSVQFDGNNVVLVTFPKEPEKLVWVQRGPTGEIPEQMLNDAVDHLIAESTDARDEAEGFSTQAQTAANSAAGSASQASDEAFDANASANLSASSAADALAAKTGAEAAEAAAEGSATAAQGYAADAQDWAESFDVSVGTTTTGAEGSNASVTVTGAGPEYQLSFTVPRGDKGEQGDPGEVSQAELDAAVASLVSGSPDALNTLDELAAALGDDPNFATTVSTEIGLRAKTSDVNAALAGKANTTHSHVIRDITGLQGAITAAEGTATWSGVSGKPASFPSTIPQVTGLQNALDNAGSNDAADLTGALTSAVDASNAIAGIPDAMPGASLGSVLSTIWTYLESFDEDKLDKSAIQLVSEFPSSPVAGVLYLKAES